MVAEVDRSDLVLMEIELVHRGMTFYLKLTSTKEKK